MLVHSVPSSSINKAAPSRTSKKNFMGPRNGSARLREKHGGCYSEIWSLVKIHIVKISQLQQTFGIVEGYDVLSKIHQPLRPEGFHHPVDVNRGETEGISQVQLRHRQLEMAVGGKTYGRQSAPHLENEVSQALACRATTDIHDPFSENRRVDQRIPPQRFGDQRPR